MRKLLVGIFYFENNTNIISNVIFNRMRRRLY